MTTRHLLAGHSLPAKVWDWAPNMSLALAPHVRDLHVLSPQPAPPGPASPLPRLAACPRLRSLTLCHVAPAALEIALEPLTLLTALNVTVHWDMAQRGWLDFAASLTCLQVGLGLRLLAACRGSVTSRQQC